MSNTTAPETDAPDGKSGGGGKPQFALVTVWSIEGEHRVGEIWPLPWGEKVTFGRGDDGTDPLRLRPFFVRPGEMVPGSPVSAEKISRNQLTLCAKRHGIQAEVTGACQTLFNEQPGPGLLIPADRIVIGKQWVFAVVSLVLPMPPPQRFTREHWGPFGYANALGLVGESAVIAALCERIVAAGESGEPVLVTGPTGSGKELVAAGVHKMSRRAAGPYVAQNAAAFADGLVEAEVFGNIRNYPNPGMPERPGLLGMAEAGTLFLDEIGSLPVPLQPKLLRAMEGDYRRLGESQANARQAHVRLVGATNEPEKLREDFRRRFKVEIEAPPLDARRQDIPLLVRSLIAKAFAKHNELACDPTAPKGAPRPLPISQALIVRLMKRPYPGNVRELERQLWKAVMGDPEEPLPVVKPPPKKPSPPREVESVHKKDIEAMLAHEDGNETETAKIFGWTRDKLRWRMIELGIDPKQFVGKRRDDD